MKKNKYEKVALSISKMLEKKQSEYVDAKYGYAELLMLIEAKLMKMRQAKTIEKRIAEIYDLAGYAIIGLANEQYYDRQPEGIVIYKGSENR